MDIGKVLQKIIGAILAKVPFALFFALADGKITRKELDDLLDLIKEVVEEELLEIYQEVK